MQKADFFLGWFSDISPVEVHKNPGCAKLVGM